MHSPDSVPLTTSTSGGRFDITADTLRSHNNAWATGGGSGPGNPYDEDLPQVDTQHSFYLDENNEEEMLETSSHSGTDDVESIYEDDERFNAAKGTTHLVLEAKHTTWQQRLKDIFEGNPHHKDAVFAFIVNFIILAAILASCTILCLESLPYYYARRGDTLAEIAQGGMFMGETICIVIFIIEAALRLYCVTFEHLKNIFFLIDTVSILGYFVDLILDGTGAGGNFSGFSIFRGLRLLRVFRIFKLSRYSKSLQLVFVVLKSSAGGLTILLVPLFLAITFFSTAIYFFEVTNMKWKESSRQWLMDNGEPGEFQSIPDAIWFSMTTITTVGYGDKVPHSSGGKIVAVAIQFIGVVTLSFPNLVLGGNLQFAFKAYHKAVARKKLAKKFRKVYNCLVFCRLLRERFEERAYLRQQQTCAADGTGGGGSSQQHVPDYMKSPTATGLGPGRAVDLDKCTDDNPLGVNTSAERDAPVIALTDSTFENSGGGVAKAVHVPMNAKNPTVQRLRVPRNYLFNKVEFELFKKEDLPQINSKNIRNWQYRNISASLFLQRVLELTSGVGTTEELFKAWPAPAGGGRVHLKDLAVVALYLADANYLQLFIFRRSSTIMLFALTQQAVMELLLHPEDCIVDCIRSAEVARYVWRRTTNTTVSFSLQPLFSTYLRWAEAEKHVDNEKYTPNTDMKNIPKKRKNKTDETTDIVQEVSAGVQQYSAFDALSQSQSRTLSVPRPGGLNGDIMEGSAFLHPFQAFQESGSPPSSPNRGDVSPRPTMPQESGGNLLPSAVPSPTPAKAAAIHPTISTQSMLNVSTDSQGGASPNPPSALNPSLTPRRSFAGVAMFAPTVEDAKLKLKVLIQQQQDLIRNLETAAAKARSA